MFMILLKPLQIPPPQKKTDNTNGSLLLCYFLLLIFQMTAKVAAYLVFHLFLSYFHFPSNKEHLFQ